MTQHLESRLIITPGGHVVATFKGEAIVYSFSPAELREFAGKLTEVADALEDPDFQAQAAIEEAAFANGGFGNA